MFIAGPETRAHQPDKFNLWVGNVVGNFPGTNYPKSHALLPSLQPLTLQTTNTWNTCSRLGTHYKKLEKAQCVMSVWLFWHSRPLPYAEEPLPLTGQTHGCHRWGVLRADAAVILFGIPLAGNESHALLELLMPLCSSTFESQCSGAIAWMKRYRTSGLMP